MWTIYKNHIIFPSLIDFLMEVLSIRIIIFIGLFFVYVIILGYLIWQLNFVILGKIINWLLLPVIVWYCDMLTIKCFISVSINIWILYDLTTKITVVQLRNFSVKDLRYGQGHDSPDILVLVFMVIGAIIGVIGFFLNFSVLGCLILYFFFLVIYFILLNDSIIFIFTNLNYFWGFGSISGFLLVWQIVSGVLLAMHYSPDINLAFNSIESIMRNVNNGWLRLVLDFELFRYAHTVGASIFFIIVYIHIGRALSYYCIGSFKHTRVLVKKKALVPYKRNNELVLYVKK